MFAAACRAHCPSRWGRLCPSLVGTPCVRGPAGRRSRAGLRRPGTGLPARAFIGSRPRKLRAIRAFETTRIRRGEWTGAHRRQKTAALYTPRGGHNCPQEMAQVIETSHGVLPRCVGGGPAEFPKVPLIPVGTGLKSCEQFAGNISARRDSPHRQRIAQVLGPARDETPQAACSWSTPHSPPPFQEKQRSWSGARLHPSLPAWVLAANSLHLPEHPRPGLARH